MELSAACLKNMFRGSAGAPGTRTQHLKATAETNWVVARPCWPCWPWRFQYSADCQLTQLLWIHWSIGTPIGTPFLTPGNWRRKNQLKVPESKLSCKLPCFETSVIKCYKCYAKYWLTCKLYCHENKNIVTLIPEMSAQKSSCFTTKKWHRHERIRVPKVHRSWSMAARIPE